MTAGFRWYQNALKDWCVGETRCREMTINTINGNRFESVASTTTSTPIKWVTLCAKNIKDMKSNSMRTFRRKNKLLIVFCHCHRVSSLESNRINKNAQAITLLSLPRSCSSKFWWTKQKLLTLACQSGGDMFVFLFNLSNKRRQLCAVAAIVLKWLFYLFFVSRLISLCCCQWKRGKSINTLLLSFCQQFDTLRVSALNALLALSVCVCKLFCHKNVFVKSTSVLFDSAVYTCNRIEGIAKFYFSAFEHRLTVGTELFLCIRSSALISA